MGAGLMRPRGVLMRAPNIGEIGEMRFDQCVCRGFPGVYA